VDSQFKKASYIQPDTSDLTWTKSCIQAFADYAALHREFKVIAQYQDSKDPQSQAVSDERRRAQLESFIQEAQKTGAIIVFETKPAGPNGDLMPAFSIRLAPRT
jgi:hypothetical protein